MREYTALSRLEEIQKSIAEVESNLAPNLAAAKAARSAEMTSLRKSQTEELKALQGRHVLARAELDARFATVTGNLEQERVQKLEELAKQRGLSLARVPRLGRNLSAGGRRRKFSAEFRNTVVSAYNSRADTVSGQSIADEKGIGLSLLQKWVSKAKAKVGKV